MTVQAAQLSAQKPKLNLASLTPGYQEQVSTLTLRLGKSSSLHLEGQFSGGRGSCNAVPALRCRSREHFRTLKLRCFGADMLDYNDSGLLKHDPLVGAIAFCASCTASPHACRLFLVAMGIGRGTSPCGCWVWSRNMWQRKIQLNFFKRGQGHRCPRVAVWLRRGRCSASS